MFSAAVILKAVVSKRNAMRSNCSHLYLGPPFHSAGERPRAPCPVCVKDKGNHEPQFLYSVRGFNKGDYDPLIPPSWFTSPPLRLDCSGKEMDALRV